MAMLFRRLGHLWLALVLIGPSWAQAACQRDEIRGSWDLYIGGGEAGEDWSGWAACTIRITTSGAARGSCVDDGGPGSRIVDGRLNVRNNCRIVGQVLIEGEGFIVPFDISRATLNRAKDGIAGAGTTMFEGSRWSGIFQMVRR
jgi:hypothetical protein